MARPLDRNRIGFTEQLAMQAKLAEMQFTRLWQIALERCGTHFVHQARRNVGHDRNIALAAHQDRKTGRGIIAAIDGEALWCPRDQFANAVHVAGSVLDADDVRNLRQTQCRFVLQIGDGTTRHVVKDDRNVFGLGNGAVMPVQTFLGRLVVVGHHGKGRIGTEHLGRTVHFDGFCG